MRFFSGIQFHLSTALVCMIVAGELLYLNTIQRKCTTYDYYSFSEGWSDYGGFTVEFGWPITCVYALDREYANCKALEGQPYPIWNKVALKADGIIFLAIVICTAVVLETLIHLRKKRGTKRKTDAT